MTQQVNINIFSGSLNMDINPSFIKEGDYVMARNVRVGFSEEDNMGCAENIRSSLEIPVPQILPGGRYMTVGCAPYEAGSKAYDFVKDTQGNDHGIYEFDLLTRTRTLVMKYPYGFGNRVASCKYFNDMLFWTDEVSDPKLIFVSLAKSGYPYPYYETTTLIKQAPDREITAVASKGAQNRNDYPLGPNQYQFIYRYVYIGNQRSTWGSPSRTVVVIDGTYEKLTLTIPGTVALQADQYQGFIKYIEIGFRSDELQPWRFMKRIDFPTAAVAEFTTEFKNDGEYPVISDLETGNPYSDVPRRCNTLDFAENRVAFAGNTYGYDEVTGISAPSIVTTTFAPVDGGVYFLQNGLYYLGVELIDAFDRRSGVYLLGSFVAKGRNGDFVATRVTFTVQGILPDWVVSWRPMISKCANKSSFLQGHIEVVSADSDRLVFSGTFVSPTPTDYAWVFTKGDRVSLLSKNLDNEAMPSAMWNLPVEFDPTINQYTVRGSFTGVTTGATIEFHTPVSNGQTRFYYETGYTFPVAINQSGQKCFGDDIPNGKTVVLDGGDTFYRVSTNPDAASAYYKNAIAATADVQAKNAATVAGYESIKDNFSFIFDANDFQATLTALSQASISASSASSAYNIIPVPALATGYSELSTAYDAAYQALVEWIQATGTGADNINAKKAAFINSYNASQAKYQEVNAAANIIIAGIQGIDRTQRPNMVVKDFENWFHSVGRSNVIPTDRQEAVYEQSTVSISDPYVQGTKINGLNMVQPSNKKTYPVELGEIMRIGVVRDYQINGSVLLVVTQYNCYAIYLGKIQYTNTDGTTQIAVSEQILGSYNLLAGGFGTIDPESVHFFGTTARGWDALKGVVWRYSQDGLTALSMEYGANSWANKIANRTSDTRLDPLQTAVSAYDPFFDEYLLCIKDVDSEDNETIAFNETKNGFSTFYDMSPDWMATLNRYTLAWKNGVLYLLRGNNDGEYNTLLGKNVQSTFSFVSKSRNPYDTLNAISARVYSQDNWSVSVKGIKTTNRTRQETEMDLTWADQREDYYDYPVDQSTEGSPMKSRHFIVELKLDPSVKELSVLYGAQTIDSISPNSPTKS